MTEITIAETRAFASTCHRQRSLHISLLETIISPAHILSVMPIQRLFSRRDARTFPNTTKEDVITRVSEFLRQAQFRIDFVAPFQLHAEQFYQKLGLRRVMDVWVSDSGTGTVVSIDFSATLGDAETAVGLVGAVLYLPLAVAVGAVSYLDYEADANAMMQSLWAYLSSGQPAPGGAPTMPRRCGNCGQPLDPDARFCKRCGAQASV
jgi:hypothetical protein